MLAHLKIGKHQRRIITIIQGLLNNIFFAKGREQIKLSVFVWGPSYLPACGFRMTGAPDAQPEPDWVKWVGGGPPTPPLERESHLQLELCKINTLTRGRMRSKHCIVSSNRSSFSYDAWQCYWDQRGYNNWWTLAVPAPRARSVTIQF